MELTRFLCAPPVVRPRVLPDKWSYAQGVAALVAAPELAAAVLVHLALAMPSIPEETEALGTAATMWAAGVAGPVGRSEMDVKEGTRPLQRQAAAVAARVADPSAPTVPAPQEATVEMGRAGLAAASAAAAFPVVIHLRERAVGEREGEVTIAAAKARAQHQRRSRGKTRPPVMWPVQAVAVVAVVARPTNRAVMPATMVGRRRIGSNGR